MQVASKPYFLNSYNMGYTVINSPSWHPITLIEAKVHLRVEHDLENDLIEGLIAAATDRAEGFLNRKIPSQKVRETWNDWNELRCIQNGKQYLELTAAPVQSIELFNYLPCGKEIPVEITSDEYRVNMTDLLTTIAMKGNASFPTETVEFAGITVEYTVGYAAIGKVPKAIKQAMLLMIGTWYDCRDDSVRNLPTASEHLLRPHRIPVI